MAAKIDDSGVVPGEDQGAELNNALIIMAQQVVFGSLSPQQVVEFVQTDKKLASLSDDELWALIEQTDRHWRAKLEITLNQPRNMLIYPSVIVACAEARLKAIGHFRQGVHGADRTALDARMDRWITRTSSCLLGQGLAFLLAPDFEAAWKTFAEANICGRAMPDSGQLRLREVMAATYGQWLAARLGEQPEIAATAERELVGLCQAPSREQEAERYWNEIREEFAPFQQLLQRKMEGPHQGKPGEVAEQTPATITVVEQAEVDKEPQNSNDPTTYAIYYVEQLNLRGTMVLAGREEPEKARQLLLQSVDFARLQAREMYFLSITHRQLAQNAPDRAVILADLNYSAAASLRGPLALSTRAYCAYALGDAFYQKAWRSQNEAGLRRSIPFFEEALSVLDADDKANSDVADILVGLASCYRILGDFPRAKELISDAIPRLELLPQRLSNLGIAFGNLADMQEKTGDLHGAAANHFKAFGIFVEAKDALHVRQALDHLTRACLKMGRLDDAAAATRQAADLLVELADIQGAVEMLLLLGQHMMRLRQYEKWLGLLQQAEDLLRPHLPPEPGTLTDPDWTTHLVEKVPPDLLALYADLLIWRGTVYTLLLKEPSGRFSVQQAAIWLESARQIAARLSDPNRLAKAITQLAALFAHAGRFDEAKTYCDMIQLVPCSPVQRQRGDEVMGMILAGQKRFPEAIEILQRSAEAFGADQKEKKFAALCSLGQAYQSMNDLPNAARRFEEALGVFEQSRLDLYEASRMEVMGYAEEIYDHLIGLYADSTGPLFRPRDALIWLEKSKSRTFTETMGLSSIATPQASASIQGELQEEKRLLEQINALRTKLFLSSHDQSDRLAVQQKMQSQMEELDSIWNRIKPHCPEYVGLRRGTTMEWNELRQILELESPA